MNSSHSADLSVIVCAYTLKRWEAMAAAIQSLQDQSAAAREIILVIDHNPELYQRVKQEYPEVVVLENQSLRGLSGARNTGIAYAQGKILAFMDEDATAEPGWIEQIASFYQDPAVLGVGGAICPAWMGSRPGWFPEEFLWVVGCTYKGMPEEPAPVRNLIGCNMSFRREVFDKAGGFRTGMGRIGTLPVGCEETELCIRANRQFTQGVFLFLPEARVWHQVPHNRGTWGYFFHRCYSEGISKAQVAHFVGAKQGLSNERTYTFRTLPQGTLRGAAEFFLHGKFSGLGQAFAIASGLTLTTLGYLVGKFSNRVNASKENEPELIGEIQYK